MTSVTDHRLRHRSDIRAVFAARCAARTESVRLHAKRRSDGESARWTVVAGKAVGTAVERNRAKRRLRAVLASMNLPAGVDVIAVATVATATASSSSLRRDVERAFDRAWGRAKKNPVEVHGG